MKRIFGLSAIVAVSAAAIACVGDDPAPSTSTPREDGGDSQTGNVDGPCYANGTCNIGLECKAGRCSPIVTGGDAGDGSIEDGSLGDGEPGDAATRPVCSGDPNCVRTIFVTSVSRTGKMGGLAGADALCTSLAGGSNDPNVKGRTFVAWLSGSAAASSAKFRHVNGTAAYVRPDGKMIALNWNALTTSQHMSAIDMDEMHVLQAGANVWTGTMPDGVATGSACGEWDTEVGNVGTYGTSNGTGNDWTSVKEVDCTQSLRLYCVEK